MELIFSKRLWCRCTSGSRGFRNRENEVKKERLKNLNKKKKTKNAGCLDNPGGIGT
jgi:hypothetical protein